MELTKQEYKRLLKWFNLFWTLGQAQEIRGAAWMKHHAKGNEETRSDVLSAEKREKKIASNLKHHEDLSSLNWQKVQEIVGYNKTNYYDF